MPVRAGNEDDLVQLVRLMVRPTISVDNLLAVKKHQPLTHPEAAEGRRIKCGRGGGWSGRERD